MEKSDLALRFLFRYSVFKVQVGLRRLELPTSRLSGVRSNQLSYKPMVRIQTFRVHILRSGGLLLFHIVSNTVPSAAQALTIVFGMGTGVSPERIATGKISLFISRRARPTSLCLRSAQPSPGCSPYAVLHPVICPSKLGIFQPAALRTAP